MRTMIMIAMLALVLLAGCAEQETIEGPFCEDLDGVCLEQCVAGTQPSYLDCKDSTLQCCVRRVR